MLKRRGVIALGALALAACSTGTTGTSGGASVSATSSSTNSGSGTTSNGGSSAGSSAGNEASSTGTGSGTGVGPGTSSGGAGSTTGVADAGCNNPQGLPAGSVCLFQFDCACGLLCAADPTGGTASLMCQAPCGQDSDCPLPNETCQKDAGLCLKGIIGDCTKPGGADLEFYACLTSTDCPCPFQCFADPAIGAACEKLCNDDSDCHELTYCNERMGSCQRSCGTPTTLPNQPAFLSEFIACNVPTDCLCPLSCYGDARRGHVCESPCASDDDCGDGGEVCETDAGACQRPFDCYGDDAGFPLWHPCVNGADCTCPLSCVDDPQLDPTGAPTPLKFCEDCTSGSCQSVPSSCQAPAVPGEFQSSGYLACQSNDLCTCPNHCTGSVQLGDLRCEQDCADDSDCRDPGQVCRNHQCVANSCFLPIACDLQSGTDFPPDAGDGTCFVSPPLNLPLCHAPGTSKDACDPRIERTDADSVCVAGMACAAGAAGDTHCVKVCGAASDCADGDTCVPSLYQCLPFDDGGNCFRGGPPIEFMGCGPGTICGCGYDCVNGVCEQPCQQDSDCNDRSLECFGTFAQSYCVP